MNSSKTTIHEFDPCIYPRLLWVVKGGTLEGIKETLEVELADEREAGGAVTMPARRMEDGRLGYCVWFPKASDIRNLGWIAHESMHVALCIFGDIGGIVTYEGQEPLAYLVGWTFECIDTIRKWKEVKHGEDSEPINEEAIDAPKIVETEEENRNG